VAAVVALVALMAVVVVVELHHCTTLVMVVGHQGTTMRR